MVKDKKAKCKECGSIFTYDSMIYSSRSYCSRNCYLLSCYKKTNKELLEKIERRKKFLT